jgi:hypothetical protein
MSTKQQDRLVALEVAMMELQLRLSVRCGLAAMFGLVGRTRAAREQSGREVRS